MKKKMSRSFYLRYFSLWLKNTYKKDSNKLTLVYSRGKTGTTTIYNSLVKHFAILFQIHTLNQRIINEQLKKFKEFKSPYPSAIVGSKYLVKRLKDYKRIDIVTVVRDPISIEISSYFQNKDKYDFSFDSQEELINYLRNREFEDGTWFDNEIKEVFGIDIFEEAFDERKGYSIMEKDNVRILLMKLEKLNDVGDLALSKFFNQEIQLVNSNLGKQKNYENEYSWVKDNFTVSDEILNHAYNSKYCRHFYTDKEIEKFKVKWSS